MSKEKSKNIFAIIMMIVITVLFGLKCLLATEISFSDEMSYIAIALRFFKGDAMLVDDWTPMQMNGFLLMPLVGIYCNLFGSTEGIALFLRFVYLLLKLIISIWAIHRLCDYGFDRKYSLLGVAFYYFFSPYNIDTLSYNTISISMLFIILIIIMTNRNRKSDCFFIGVSLAIAIISHPFIMLVYITFSFALIVNMVINKDEISKKRYGKIWLYITLGSIFVAVIFMLFIFFRANISDIINNLPYIFREPDHNMGVFEKIKNLFFDFFINYLFITIINVLSLCVYLFLKKENYFRFLSICSLGISIIYLLLFEDSFIQNIIYIPFMWFALEQIILCHFEKKITLAYVIILISSIGVYLGTNTRMLSTSATMSIFASLSCFAIALRENFGDKIVKMTSIVIVTILIFSFVTRLFIVWTSWFKVENFQQYIDRGPLKGMYTINEVYDSYYKVINDFDSIDCKEGKILFCGTSTPLTYLYSNLEYGTMGVSFFSLDYERLNKYWEMHSDKKPDIIYYLELSNTDEEINFLKIISNQYQIEIVDNRLIAIRK